MKSEAKKQDSHCGGEEIENEEAPRRWMIFSYFANIDGKASSQHLDDRLPHMVSMGIRPVLISSICSERRTDLPHLRVLSAAPSGLRFELRYLRRRNKLFKVALFPALLAVLPFYLLEKLIINLESQWSWFPIAFLRGLLACREFEPQVIYSTGGPASAHLAAGMVARVRNIPWIAELQDPIVINDWSRSRTALKLNAGLERFILERASAVVFLTAGAKERASERTGTDPERCHVIYPGASPMPEQRTIYSRGGLCRFAHFGSLGGTRNVESFLEALRIEFLRDPDLARIVRLDLYGTTDGFSRKLMADFEYPGVVSDHGKISRSEALRAMACSDVLLLIQNRDDQSCETIPSKAYEYFQITRPVLGLVYRNAPLGEMLLSQGHFAVEADSPAEIANRIGEIVAAWRKGEWDSPRFEPSPFTVRSAVERLVALAQEASAFDLRGETKVPEMMKARIGHIIHNYKPILGGGEVYVSELIRAVPEHEHIVFQKYSGDADSELRHVRPWKKPFKSFRTALQFQYFRELTRQDLLISHDLNNLLPLFASKSIAVNHSVTWHDPQRVKSNKRNLEKALYAFKKSKGLVANSTAFFREMGLSEIVCGTHFFEEIEEKRWLIPNCIDTEKFGAGPFIPAVKDMKVVLVPRRIDAGRGLGLALDAFAFILGACPESNLLIVGDIGTRSYFEQLQESIHRQGLTGKVFFTGRVPHDHMPDFYRSALLTLIPTLHTEGTSLSALESMACGCPTFSTDVGGLGDLPTVKIPVDPSKASDQIVNNLPSLEAIGKNQMEAVRRDFGLGRWRTAWQQIIQRCLT